MSGHGWTCEYCAARWGWHVRVKDTRCTAMELTGERRTYCASDNAPGMRRSKPVDPRQGALSFGLGFEAIEADKAIKADPEGPARTRKKRSIRGRSLAHGGGSRTLGPCAGCDRIRQEMRIGALTHRELRMNGRGEAKRYVIRTRDSWRYGRVTRSRPAAATMGRPILSRPGASYRRCLAWRRSPT